MSEHFTNCLDSIMCRDAEVELDRIAKISYDNSNYRNDYLIIEEDIGINYVFAVVEDINFKISPKEIAVEKKVHENNDLVFNTAVRTGMAAPNSFILQAGNAAVLKY